MAVVQPAIPSQIPAVVPPNLLVDCVESYGDLTFAVDVPNGVWQGFVHVGNVGTTFSPTPRDNLDVSVNGVPIASDTNARTLTMKAQFINALAAGDVCVSVSWNNLALQARQRGAEAARPVRLEYVIPKEGASIWFDTAVIPVDAPHPDNAHAFLNFLMEPEVIAAISNDIHGANGSLAALEYLNPEVRDDPATYPPPEARAWTRVKAGE